MEFIFQLALIIIATKIAGDIAVRLGQPAVLGKLIVGVILGPALLGWIHHTDVLETFSYIGVLLLMFFAGLETDLAELNRNRKASVNVALGGILLPFAAGYFTGIWFDLSFSNALFLGLLLSATSVSISVQTFKEMGQFRSKESSTVLGAALVDDILVVIFLAVLMSILTSSEISIATVIGKKFAFFAIAGIIAWKIIPLLMKGFAKLKINEPIISAGIAICLLFALMAESLGVAGIIGSFLAGVGISQTTFRQEIEHKLEPIAYAIFVPVFFVSIGLSIQFDGFLDNWLFTFVLSMIAIFSKWIGAGLGAKGSGFSTRSALIVGAGMISRGEVALIIATIGLEAGLVHADAYTSIIIAIMISTLVSPPLLKGLFHSHKTI